MQEYICDLNFWMKHYDDFVANDKDSVLIATYFNFFDLLASDSNLKDPDGRLENTFFEVLRRIKLHHIIPEEPYFEIIDELFPNKNVQYSNKKDSEINGPSGYLTLLTTIEEKNYKDIPHIRENILKFARESKIAKEKQKEEIKAKRKKIKFELKRDGKNQKDYKNWIPSVELFLKGEIQRYAMSDNICEPFFIKPDDIDVSSCELYINSLAYYLSHDEETPDKNDHVDVLQLLYVRNGRKILMEDSLWTGNIIKGKIGVLEGIGLKDKYLDNLV